MLADFSRAASLGFESGKDLTPSNPLGEFIKGMLLQSQQMRTQRMEEESKMRLLQKQGQIGVAQHIIQNSSPSSMTYADPLTKEVNTYVADSGFTPEQISGAYQSLGMQPPATSGSIDNVIPGATGTSSENKLPPGATVTRSGGKVKIKEPPSNWGTSTVAFARDNAKSILDAYDQTGEVDYASIDRLDARSRAAAISGLKSRGVDISKASLGYKAKQSATTQVKIAEQKLQNINFVKPILDRSYDPKTGEYKIPPTMHTELAIATARVLSPSGQISENMVEELKQGTLQEKAAKMAIWFGMDPKQIGGTTQGVAKMFVGLLQAEAQKAEEVRNQYLEGGLSSNPFKQSSPIPGMTNSNSLEKEIQNMSDEELRAIIGGK